MEQPSTVPSAGKVSLIYGVIIGLIVGVIDSAYSAWLNAANPPFVQALYRAFPPSANSNFVNTIVSLVVSIPIYLLLFIAFVLAGLFASRKTHKISTGLLAALWTGIVFEIMDLVVATIVISYLIVFPQIAQSLPGTSASDIAAFQNSTLTFSIWYSIIVGLILIGIGTGFGALGGLLGKSTSKPAVPVQPYTDAYPNPNPYQYQPYQMQPYAPPDQPPYGQEQQPGQVPPAPPNAYQPPS